MAYTLAYVKIYCYYGIAMETCPPESVSWGWDLERRGGAVAGKRVRSTPAERKAGDYSGAKNS
jgi:hypothetical protein